MLADRWRSADHTAGGNTLKLTSAYVPAHTKGGNNNKSAMFSKGYRWITVL